MSDEKIDYSLYGLPKDTQGIYVRYTEKDLLDGFREEALRHREKIKQLQDQLQEKENIIKEVREYIKSNEFIGRIRLSSENKQAINKLLQILDKERL